MLRYYEWQLNASLNKNFVWKLLGGNSTGVLIPLPVPDDYNELKITYKVTSENEYFVSMIISKGDILSTNRYFFAGTPAISTSVKASLSGITPTSPTYAGAYVPYWCSVSYR